MTHYDTALQRYLTAWELSDAQPLAETVTSHIYTVKHQQTTVILKILAPDESEERMGALALRHFNGRGAVRLLNSDDGAHLLEYADGANVAELVQSGQDEAATAIIADVINALHADDSPPPEGVRTLRRWFRALFWQAEQDRAAGQDTIMMRAAKIADEVLDHPITPRVLHGDIHHENIRQSPRGWLAFDPKGLYGERTYDLANTLCNPRPEYGVESADERRILRNAAILAERCGIERSRVLLFLYLYACLSACWTMQEATTGWDLSNILRIAAIAERNL